jgi:hypothetical protein
MTRPINIKTDLPTTPSPSDRLSTDNRVDRQIAGKIGNEDGDASTIQMHLIVFALKP